MKFPAFDRDLARTVLFALAVVLVVIGIYQSILQNSVVRNYELFMLAIICLLLFRYLKPVEEAAPPAKPQPARKPAAKAKKRR
jgi:4-amino-4-deoxy-L-arabinose transferase-like glycosyltransferase